MTVKTRADSAFLEKPWPGWPLPSVQDVALSAGGGVGVWFGSRCRVSSVGWSLPSVQVLGVGVGVFRSPSPGMMSLELVVATMASPRPRAAIARRMVCVVVMLGSLGMAA